MTSDVLTNSSWTEHSTTPVGAERAEADRLAHEVEKRKATRVVASASTDVADARDLLSMLGLEVDDVRAALGQHSAAA